MAQLPTLHPDVHDNFMKGHFVVQRSDKKFSLMSLDQSQEHSIWMLKEDGGPKGLYNQVEEKMVIELSRTEVLRVVEEFEDGTAHINPETNQEHPESSTSEQQKLLRQVSSLLELVEEQIIVDPYLSKKLSSLLWTLVNIWILKYLAVWSRCHWLGRLCMTTSSKIAWRNVPLHCLTLSQRLTYTHFCSHPSQLTKIR